jgi:energy-coupling factor transporter ATP-binding protein EcfA2
MTDPKATPPAKDNGESKMSGKEKFVRAMITLLTSDEARYYARGERVYVDSSILKGAGLMLLQSGEFSRHLLHVAKKSENILLRTADADLIIDHVLSHALRTASQLSADNRARFLNGHMALNTGWENGNLLILEPEQGTWSEGSVDEPVFEPVPYTMRLPVPVSKAATEFPKILKAGIADFGDTHCLIAVSCATMLLPATFPHPFLVFTGAQARGKSTTMKLILQLIDPNLGGELMTVGEDTRDLVALCRDRHCIAMDNVSHLPFDEDLLSKMYSGGQFAARKMTTNSELSVAMMPRLRVMINGVGTSFSRSDLMSRCIFIDHPVLTSKGKGGQDAFVPVEHIEARWAKLLPEALGSLLTAVSEGWKLFLAQGGLEDKTSECRYVEYAIIGECMSQVMGFEPVLFTEQVYRAAEAAKEGAIEADDTAQLILAYLNGEKGQDHQFEAFNDPIPRKDIINTPGYLMISSTDLFKEIRAIAQARNYSIYGLKWLNSVRAFSTAIIRSQKNIETGGWSSRQVKGGEHKRNWEFFKVK